MKTYFDTNTKKDCTGCGVCSLRCPKKAITMTIDEEGFLYPKIDKNKCINCGICKKICANKPEKNLYDIKTFAVKSKNNTIRKNSTSGGAFKEIVKYVLDNKGIVCGVEFDKNLNVKHTFSTTMKECQKYSFSKYVRSDHIDTYVEIEKKLKNKQLVLFSGTPCQCYGLKKYLQKEYENLILCEIICHSNPSPMVYKMYLNGLEKKYNKRIKEVHFRTKNEEYNKPHVTFEDNSKISIQAYNNAFNNMLISRPSCANCHFCDKNRKADITIGDFWGIEQIHPDFYDNNGISLVCINSEKGLKVFNNIKKNLTILETTLEEGFKYNHNSNIPENKFRKKFFNHINNGKINENNIIYFINKYSKASLVKRIHNKIKKCIMR